MGIIPDKLNNIKIRLNKSDLLTDIAYTDSSIRWNFGSYNPNSLVRSKGIRIYEDMLKDEQIKVCLHLRRFPIIAGGWRIEAGGTSPEDVKIREFVEYTLDQIEGTFNEKLLIILSAIQFGFSCSEKVYSLIKNGEWAGKIILKDIKGKHPADMNFICDEFGNVLGLTQDNNTGEPLPLEKFIIFSYDETFSNPYGRSILDAAYRAWFTKDINLKFWNIYNERYGAPTVIGQYPPQYRSLQNSLSDILNNLQSKTSIVVPEEIQISLLQAAGGGGVKSGDTFERIIKTCDIAISKSLFIPANLGFGVQQSIGSYAQAKAQFEAFLDWIIEPDRIILADIISDQLIKQLVDLNFPKVQNYPRFVFNLLSSLEKDKMADVWINAVKGGAVQSGLDDENTFRRLINFPEKLEETNKEQLKPNGDKNQIFPNEVGKGNVGGGQIENTPVKQETVLQESSKFSKNEKYKVVNDYDKRVDFNKIRNYLDNIEELYIESIEKLLGQEKNNLVYEIRNNQISLEYINGLNFSGVGRTTIIDSYKNLLIDSYNRGRDLGYSLIPRKYLKKKKYTVQLGNMPPEEALKYFEQKAFYIAGIQNDSILKKVKAVLYNHIKVGSSTQEAIYEIEKVFSDYINEAEEDMGNQDMVNSGYRLETIVRTNVTEAHANGMLNTFKNEDLKDVVVGVQYSAILDERTTQICEHLHGSQFDISDPEVDRITPPNHFNCRSTWVPIFIEEVFTPISKSDLNAIKELIPTGFY